MGASEHSYRGVFDREKKVRWGIRKQLHFCVVVANRTQVTEITVFPKGSLTLLQDLVHEWFVSLFRFPVLLASSCSFQHKPPASCRPTTLFWHSLPTLLISNTILPYNHTAIPPCQPHHSSASCTSMFSLSLSIPCSASAPDQWLHSLTGKGFFCTVPNLSTSPPTPVTLSVTKGNQKFQWQVCLASGYFYMLDGQVIWLVFH